MEEEEEEEDEKTDIKSNNPHLTGGEKITSVPPTVARLSGCTKLPPLLFVLPFEPSDSKRSEIGTQPWLTATQEYLQYPPPLENAGCRASHTC